MNIYIEIFLVIILCVLIWFVIRFVTKFFLKIVLIVFAFLIAFLGFWYLSDKNIFDTMSQFYCSDKNDSKKIKCECFVSNINSDLEKRFNASQIDSIKNDPIKSIAEFKFSYDNKKEDISACFKNKGLSSSLAEEIKNDIIEKAAGFLKSFDE